MPMTREQLGMLVIETIANTMSLKKEYISLDSSFAADLGMDSLDGVELFMEMEEKFGIELHEGEEEGIKCVGDVVELIIRKRPGLVTQPGTTRRTGGQKAACRRCGATILAQTSRATGGLCVKCGGTPEPMTKPISEEEPDAVSYGRNRLQSMSSLRILARSVWGFTFSNAAAPWGPSILPLVAARAASMCLVTTVSRGVISGTV